MPGSMILLIEKNSPKEIAQVIDAAMKMRSVAAVASTTPATVAGIGSVSTSAITERKKRAKKSTAASKNAHAQTSPRAAGSIAPTRPLNSWMAFRSKFSYCNAHFFSNWCRLPLSHLQVLPAEGHLRILDLHVAERPFQGQVEHPC